MEENFQIESLGERRVPSPVKLSKVKGDFVTDYVEDDLRIVMDGQIPSLEKYYSQGVKPPSFEVAGPREKIYFDPRKIRAAMVTCGGLCPGINDVIRSAVLELWYWYGVRHIVGIRYGYKGFLPEYGYDTIELTPERVESIHHTGGTMLGSSRGNVPAEAMVDALERMDIRVLFTIGGDGTQKGALAIHDEVEKRGLKIAVVGIPKTIDNDILFVEKTFGYETAVSLAVDVIRSAHNEALGAYNGIGMVKLMGRDSGFIAASAGIATHDVNFVLVPELPFHLDGENGFLRHLKNRLITRHHAVVCVAEGAGQDLMGQAARAKDASGNVKHADIGVFLCEKMKEYLTAEKVEHTIKYIDPSYIIRSAPAIPIDSVYCAELGQNAVHAAMAGKTGLVVGMWNSTFTHVPMTAIISGRKKIDPESLFWLHVMESTGQPLSMRNGS